MDAVNSVVIICVGLFFFGNNKCSALPEDVLTAPSCNGLDSVLNCTVDGLIFVRNIKVGAKPKTENCPVAGYTTFDEKCCQGSTGDCTAEYTDTQSIREDCMDKTQCEKTVTSSTISCTPPNNFPPANNFFEIDYSCIDKSRTGSVCGSVSASVTSPDVFYLRNQHFPNPISQDDKGCTCSIETDKCDGNIRIYTTYLKLEENSAGVCKQTLSFVDGETSFIYTCANSTDYSEHVEHSTGTYLTFKLKNEASADMGNFMVGFQASGNSATLHVNCPAKTKTPCPAAEVTTMEGVTETMTTVTTAEADNSTNIVQTTASSNTTASDETQTAGVDKPGLTSVSGRCVLIMLSVAAIVI